VIGDILKGLAAWFRTGLPALLGYLLGQARAESSQAKSDADTLKTQNEIAARPDATDPELVEWLRRQ
jgi:hypothetical protein